MRKKAPPFIARGNFPVNFAVTAHIRGKFSVEQLQAALVKLRQRHILTGIHIVAEGDERWFDTEGAPPFPIRVVQDGNWAREVEQELNQVFDVFAGMIRFVIVETNDDYTDLIMVCHHGLADGMSAAYALRDILFYMANPNSTVEPLPLSPPMDELLPPVDFETLDFSDNPSRPQSNQYGIPSRDSSEFYVVPAELSESQTTALVARCKREQTSVHAALCTAFLLAIEQVEQHELDAPRILSSPVNVRSRLPQPIGEQFGMYISPSVRTVLNCREGRPFWDMAREFKEALSRDTADDQAVFKATYFFRWLGWKASTDPNFRWENRPSFADYDLSITNLGRLDFPVEYGALCLEAIYGPAVNPLGREKVMGVATIGNRLTFTFLSPYQLMDRPLAERLMGVALQTLAQAVS